MTSIYMYEHIFARFFLRKR